MFDRFLGEGLGLWWAAPVWKLCITSMWNTPRQGTYPLTHSWIHKHSFEMQKKDGFVTSPSLSTTLYLVRVGMGEDWVFSVEAETGPYWSVCCEIWRFWHLSWRLETGILSGTHRANPGYRPFKPTDQRPAGSTVRGLKMGPLEIITRIQGHNLQGWSFLLSHLTLIL